MTAQLIATLRLHSPTLSAEEISSFINVGPTQIFKRGEPVSRRSTSLRDNTFCRLEAEESDVDGLDDQVRWLISQLLPSSIKAIQDKLLEVDIFVGIFMGDSQAGIQIDSSIAALLAEHHCSLIFDIYSED